MVGDSTERDVRGNTMSDSRFRQWFEYLGKLHGRRVEWSQLIRHIINEELSQLRSDGTPYVSEVFIDRDRDAYRHQDHPKQDREDVSVQRLYRVIHERYEGQLQVDDFPVWLISYAVPNQSAEGHRCADLLGLKLDGSLVVFECKVEDNYRDSPFRAVFEGLDYLGHLLVPANTEKLITGFDRWREKPRNEDVLSKIPPQFRDVTVNPDARHALIVLAPKSYFSFHEKDAKGNPQDWHLLSDRKWKETALSVGLDFATTDTDFTSADCPLLEL